MEKKLVIVESPTKARTIGNMLGKDCTVESTMGHIRDLPANEFGVELDKDFLPKYVIIPGKKKLAGKLKTLAKNYTQIYLATDEDREGEAIAWHTVIALNKNLSDVKRVAFHEITPEAVKNAFQSPREISLDLVNAQQTRRILDRIVGYTLSPFLGKYLEKGLSAGRVQSVALRLIVEREKEIRDFKPQEYWSIKANVFEKNVNFLLELTHIENKKIEQFYFKEEKDLVEIMGQLKEGSLYIKEIKETERKVNTFPPFVTSTLQQNASIKLHFSGTKTMFIAQQLYEGISIEQKENIGLITYMRTDSPSIAKQAQTQAFKYIIETFGKDFVPDKPPVYKAKLATAQEAHEAIRPSSVYRTPESLKPFLNDEQFALYKLIWDRFVASQMKHANVKNLKIMAMNGIYGFTGENNKIIFPGFTKVWPVKIDEGIEILEELKEGNQLNVEEYLTEEHFTKPSPRYTEASLIKTLEKFGIGRPSTYAPTVATLKNRGYISVEKRNFIPEKIGEAVNEILVKFFSDVIRTDFTAQMEEDLDKIAQGEKNWTGILKNFYELFKPTLDKAYQDIAKDPAFVNELFAKDKICPKCGKNLVLRRSKYGIFLGCSNYPNCKHIEKVKKNARNSRYRPKRK